MKRCHNCPVLTPGVVIANLRVGKDLPGSQFRIRVRVPLH